MKKLRSIQVYNVISYEYTSEEDKKVVTKKTSKTVKKGEKK